MKFFKRAAIYKASNVTYKPETREAFSYAWWQFVKVINGKTVFNKYHYSQSTCGHQSKVHRVMSALGQDIDINVETPRGLQSNDLKTDLIQTSESFIRTLQNEQAKGKPASRAYQERARQIQFYCNQLNFANTL